MMPNAKAAEVLQQVIDNMLPAPGDGGSKVSVSEWTKELTRRLADVGFKVDKDYHYLRSGDEHSSSCYHCGRPENAEPFVVPGTPLELRSSEGEEGRFRHWGGDDLWVCRKHPDYIDGDRVETSTWGRTMDLHEAFEHLAARDGMTDILYRPASEIEALKAAHAAANADRLAALDGQAPRGGHKGAAAIRASRKRVGVTGRPGIIGRWARWRRPKSRGGG